MPSYNEQWHKVPGLLAGAALTAYQNHYCNLEADGDINVTNVQVGGMGVLLNKPASGAACEIAGHGSIVMCKVSGNVTPGLLLMVDTSNVGQLTECTNDKVKVAFALTTVASGNLALVYLLSPSLCSDSSDMGVGNS